MTVEATVTNKRLHVFLRHPMQLCRIVGFFPVEGLDNKSITNLRFNLRSVYALYHISTLISQTVLASLSIYYFFNNDIMLDNLKILLFYLTGLISALLLLKLAKNWPHLIKRASNIENLISDVRSEDTSKPWRQDIIPCGVMLLALFEHVLSITFQMKLVMQCNQDFSINLNLIKKYFLKTTFVFDFTTYTEWKAVLFEIANLQATFLWNITDVVTICSSLYLTSYFQDLNKLIERQEKQNFVNWKDIRVFYSYMVELVNAVDQNMCYLILMSLFTNLFFICIQLFYLTNHDDSVLTTGCDHDDRFQFVFYSWEHTVYYAYSFIFLFTRASATSLLAANINTLAQRPLLILHNVSPSEYTIDVQRFIRQIRYTTTALSGLFFYITRGMIITVIGTVIKYEMVMLQFNINKD